MHAHMFGASPPFCHPETSHVSKAWLCYTYSKEEFIIHRQSAHIDTIMTTRMSINQSNTTHN